VCAGSSSGLGGARAQADSMPLSLDGEIGDSGSVAAHCTTWLDGCGKSSLPVGRRNGTHAARAGGAGAGVGTAAAADALAPAAGDRLSGGGL
jgi:hypothetical protein